jgi:DNA-binding NtrC family response regulator
MENKILIVDDEREMCVSLQKLFLAHGICSDFCTDGIMARQKISQHSYSLLISDLKMPGLSGLELLKEIRTYQPSLYTLMISGYASTEAVVQAMRLGATNFYEKPVPFSILLKEVQKLLGKENEEKTDQLENPGGCPIITVNPHMKHIIAMAEKAAHTDAPVIITGESGTGKELVASIIHESSERNMKAFIKINCAALPDALLESELFGYEKGAFTDAKESRKGKFEAAEGGTVFFDEISDMSLQTQSKLLRVLQEHEYERLGSNQTRKANIRFVAATNKDLQQCIAEGKFREDLYFRLSVICLTLPPLKERIDDIMPLTKKFIADFNGKYKKAIQGIDKNVQQIFFNHPWPGNIRELKNCIERAVIFCESREITPVDLPTQYHLHTNLDEYGSMKCLFDTISREMILDALEKVEGSRTKAAELLNISRKTLYLKMKNLGIEF